MFFFKKHWPVFASLAIFLVIVAAVLPFTLAANEGHFSYSLDDAYIHMAMAKHLSQDGVLGMTQYAFTSSTSSPLWTLALAGVYAVFGVNDYAPFVMNLLAAIGAVFVAYTLFRRYFVSRLRLFLCVLALMLIAPLPSLVYMGMEHTLQVMLLLVFVSAALRMFECLNDAQDLRWYRLPGIWRILSSVLLLAATRYETGFIVFVLCIMLFMYRRWFAALLIGAVSALPMVAYGLYSLHQDWFFFPNSVLLKGHLPTDDSVLHAFAGYARYFYMNFISTWDLTLLLIVASLVCFRIYRRKGEWSHAHGLVLFIATVLLHYVFARGGRFYRYDAYLVVFGFVVLVIVGRSYLDRGRVYFSSIGFYQAIFVYMAVILITPLSVRAFVSIIEIPSATDDIYQQHHQMAKFLGRYYDGEVVAANDIGAISYYTDIRLFDVWGLANKDVASAIRANAYTPQKIQSIAIAHGAKIAVVYTRWFEQKFGGLPQDWFLAGEWSIRNQTVAGGLTVSFYAIADEEKELLQRHLRDFSSEVSKKVIQEGAYTR